MDDRIKSWALKLSLSYALIGTVYYLSGFVWLVITGRQVVFSPLVGFPLTLLGWPPMLYADLIHRESLGIRPHTILALITVLGIGLMFIWQAIWGHINHNKDL